MESTYSRNIYYYDVEAGFNGWNASGLWHITNNRYYSPGHSLWYGNEENKNYDTGLENSGELISPLINLTNTRKPFLYFNSWYQTRSDDIYDKKLVLISEANSSWIELNEVNHEQKIWIRETIDLSGYAGKEIRIKFFFNTIDNNYNKHEGWYIDDIIIMEE
ncbi:MAG: hypothetical protein FIB08_16955 [Candidatus Methanoperedens sp.]|nr:hypothetical protein [Candidatus Methanoperedens sp.]